MHPSREVGGRKESLLSDSVLTPNSESLDAGSKVLEGSPRNLSMS